MVVLAMHWEPEPGNHAGTEGVLTVGHIVRASLRVFVEQLAREAFAATESLKEYIGYSVEEGEEAGGFEEHFPEEVMLSHAVAAYELLLRF